MRLHRGFDMSAATMMICRYFPMRERISQDEKKINKKNKALVLERVTYKPIALCHMYHEEHSMYYAVK